MVHRRLRRPAPGFGTDDPDRGDRRSRHRLEHALGERFRRQLEIGPGRIGFGRGQPHDTGNLGRACGVGIDVKPVGDRQSADAECRAKSRQLTPAPLGDRQRHHRGKRKKQRRRSLRHQGSGKEQRDARPRQDTRAVGKPRQRPHQECRGHQRRGQRVGLGQPDARENRLRSQERRPRRKRGDAGTLGRDAERQPSGRRGTARYGEQAAHARRGLTDPAEQPAPKLDDPGQHRRFEEIVDTERLEPPPRPAIVNGERLHDAAALLEAVGALAQIGQSQSQHQKGQKDEPVARQKFERLLEAVLVGHAVSGQMVARPGNRPAAPVCQGWAAGPSGTAKPDCPPAGRAINPGDEHQGTRHPADCDRAAEPHGRRHCRQSRQGPRGQGGCRPTRRRAGAVYRTLHRRLSAGGSCPEAGLRRGMRGSGARSRRGHGGWRPRHHHGRAAAPPQRAPQRHYRCRWRQGDRRAFQDRPAELRRVRREARVPGGTRHAGPGQFPRRAAGHPDLRGHLG